MIAPRLVAALLLALAVVAGAALWLQRQAAAGLRAEITLLRAEDRDLARLRGENARLAAGQISADKLEQLRADHAAVQRMRHELEALKTDLEKRERALARPITTDMTSIAAPARGSGP